MRIDKQISYLILTVASCFLGLSICLFLPAKKVEISQEKRSLAQFLDRCAKAQKRVENLSDTQVDSLEKQRGIMSSKIFSSPIKISCKSDKASHCENPNKDNDEIDFSHIKGILERLDYYPLKDQDKKSAKELEKAILDAEENGLDMALKQTINEGLGALLKIMAKYAV